MFHSMITEIMQDISAILEFSDWSRDKGLEVNRKYKMESFKLSELNDIELKLSRQAKYPGIFPDNELS